MRLVAEPQAALDPQAALEPQAALDPHAALEPHAALDPQAALVPTIACSALTSALNREAEALAQPLAPTDESCDNTNWSALLRVGPQTALVPFGPQTAVLAHIEPGS
jgi:hypothetical protein